MRSNGLYDATRGLLTALAVAAAGFLLWLATQVGQASRDRYWAATGIVVGGGLVLALLPALGGRAAGLRLRLSRGGFLLGFLPALVVVAWILAAGQPGGSRVDSWSRSIGVSGLVHDFGLWHGALALGLGLVLGLSLHAVPAVAVVEDAAVEPRPPADEPLSAERATVSG